MKIPINYAIVATKYLKQMKEVETKIRKSTSKHKADPINTFDWFLDFSVKINAYSFQDILNGKDQKGQKDTLSIEDRVKEQMKNVNAFITAEKGRGKWFSDTSAKDPTEIKEHYRKQFEADDAEKFRMSALTPEENQKEIDDLLKELEGPGFVKIMVKRN